MKLLLVDDNPIDLMLNEKVIKGILPDAEILKSDSATNALNILRSGGNKLDMIFLDIRMPMMNGFELLDAIEKDDGLKAAGFKVLMVSSSVDPNDKQKASTYSKVIGFVEKPVTEGAVEAYLN